MGWLIYRVTGSAFLLGFVGFISQIPAAVISPFGGVLADRWNLHRMVIVTQVFAMIQAGILAALVLSGHIQVWHIIALSALLGIITAFDIPARQSFIVHMVENREDLSNAIALNSAMFNGARLVGPSLAGVLVAAVGEGWCFLLNALSYIAVLIALLAMRLAPANPRGRDKKVLAELKEGLAYAARSPFIRGLLVLLSLVSLVGMPYATLMPIFAKDILKGGPDTLGFLMAASGVGALVGAVYLAARHSVVGLERWIAAGPILFGIGLILFARSQTLWVSLCVLTVTGFAMMVQMASSNTLLQTVVDDDKRGRVMSFYTMAFMGTAPIGSLLAGSLAHRLGAPDTVVLCGALSIAGGVIFTLLLPTILRTIHPVYVRLGIITDDPSQAEAEAEAEVDSE